MKYNINRRHKKENCNGAGVKVFNEGLGKKM